MTKNYTVKRPFWRKGLLVEAGAIIELSDREAKYIGHIVEEFKVEAAPVVDAAPVAEAAGEEASAVVVEQAAPAVAHRRKSHASDGRSEAADGDGK